MTNKINLHFSSIHRGPGKVVENLVAGLKKIGVEVGGNESPQDGIFQICLQPVSHIRNLSRNTLMGPNLFVLPSEWGDFCKNFDHYVVPSEWVQKKYREFNNLDHASIDIWPVGINTEIWNKEIRKTGKVLIYSKNRDPELIREIESSLNLHGIKYQNLNYGSYLEKDLHRACLECESCILVTNTESQGIAYMQILSMGIPCYVLDKKVWNNEGTYKDVAATSVPYFGKECGIIREFFEINDFLEFIRKFEIFEPRKYIEENHTLEKSAINLVSILERINANL